MPLLVLLNGAPGTGKSTLARQWAAAHPLSLALDIDLVRSMIGGWQEHTTAAGMMARKLALSMVETAFSQGHDVVIPQLVGKPEFIDDLSQVGQRHGVPLVHVVLTASVETCVRRCQTRDNTMQWAAPERDLVAMVSQAVDAINDVAGDDALYIDTDGAISGAVARFSDVLSGYQQTPHAQG